LEIDQRRIDDFAVVIGDVQWILSIRSVPPKSCRTGQPLPMVLALVGSEPKELSGFFLKNYTGMCLRVNYGLNKLFTRNRSYVRTGFVPRRWYNRSKKPTYV